MLKKLLGIIGILVFIAAAHFGFLLFRSENLARGKDGVKHAYGIIQGPPPCAWELSTPERILKEGGTQALLIITRNTAQEQCASTLTLQAPGFDINPNKEEQEVTLPPQGKGSISWILSPKGPGTYDISVSDSLDTKIFGVTVTNTFGLSATQAKVVSIAGSLFGPMFTIPWWLERLWNKKKQKKDLSSKND